MVDDETRCEHYNGPTDVVALRFACCESYFPCFECHGAVESHPAIPWPVTRFEEPAVLCGVCSSELTVGEYAGASSCPSCSAPFNPRCALHYHLYFEGFAAPND